MGYGIFRRIFTLADQLEPDRRQIWDWLYNTPIETLDGRTAVELVFADRGEQVVAALEAALRENKPGKLPGRYRALSRPF